VFVSNFEMCGYLSTLGVGPGRNFEAKHPSVSVFVDLPWLKYKVSWVSCIRLF